MPVSFPLTIGQCFDEEVTERGKTVKRFNDGARGFGSGKSDLSSHALTRPLRAKFANGVIPLVELVSEERQFDFERFYVGH